MYGALERRSASAFDSRARDSARRLASPLVWLVPIAIGLRILVFLGRGDFVAFDESWYLLLGQHLWAGEGYTLSGLRHTTLSPLFPILAGATALLIDSSIWAGRLVAAVAGGLLVIPCWSIFNRIVGSRTALLACIIIAVLPSLAPFTVPYWVGWDLWMGPEPVYHLFLFSGVALALRGQEHGEQSNWIFAGAALALAYLARPEAIVVAGCLGGILSLKVLINRSRQRVIRLLIFAATFVVVAAPYWLYLHDALGRWTITGRHVEVPRIRNVESKQAPGRGGAAKSIERMIWQGEQDDYMDVLFALHPSGERLASSYWGVPPVEVERSEPDGSRLATAAEMPAPAATAPAVGGPEIMVAEQTESGAAEAITVPNRLLLYFQALGVVVPGFVWPFILLGALLPRRRRGERERFLAVPLIAASAMIAGWVAVDPRTQLFIAPLLALYAARGIRLLGLISDRRLRGGVVRRGLVTRALAGGVIAILFIGNANRLYSAVREGSPHHILGAESRRVGHLLRELVPEKGAVMSWDASVALHAGRDWRVLPYGTFPEIARYAAAIGCEYVVLSRFFPAPEIMDQLQANFLVLRLTPTQVPVSRWHLELTGGTEGIVFGRVIAE